MLITNNYGRFEIKLMLWQYGNIYLGVQLRWNAWVSLCDVNLQKLGCNPSRYGLCAIYNLNCAQKYMVILWKLCVCPFMAQEWNCGHAAAKTQTDIFAHVPATLVGLLFNWVSFKPFPGNLGDFNSKPWSTQQKLQFIGLLIMSSAQPAGTSSHPHLWCDQGHGAHCRRLRGHLRVCRCRRAGGRHEGTEAGAAQHCGGQQEGARGGHCCGSTKINGTGVRKISKAIWEPEKMDGIWQKGRGKVAWIPGNTYENHETNPWEIWIVVRISKVSINIFGACSRLGSLCALGGCHGSCLTKCCATGATLQWYMTQLFHVWFRTSSFLSLSMRKSIHFFCPNVYIPSVAFIIIYHDKQSN